MEEEIWHHEGGQESEALKRYFEIAEGKDQILVQQAIEF